MTHSHESNEPARPTASSLKIAYAIARQRVQDLHFHEATELIERGRGEIAAPQALAVYIRVHRLSESDAQALKNRIMVHMGRAAHADIQHLPNTFVAIDGAVEWDINASLVERIRKRVGGRRRHALREWVELHTGHVEVQLQRVHVECLRGVREAAGPGIRLRDLVGAYSRELGVRESVIDALYFAFAGHLFADYPAGDRSDGSAAEEAGGGGAGSPQAVEAGVQTEPAPGLKRRQA